MRKQFKKLTLKQKCVMFFENKGYEKVKTRSSKYEVFSKDENKFYFVGKNGAIRHNNKKTSTDSYSSIFALAHIKKWIEKQNQSELIKVIEF